MRVVLTDGNQRSTLAVARDLARDGHDVLVGSRTPRCLVAASRCVSEEFVYPPPSDEPEAFIDCLVDVVRTAEADFLIPMTDVTASLVLSRRNRFGSTVTIPFPSGEVWDRSSDKALLLEHADRLGIPVPRSVVLQDPGDIPDLPADFAPFVVKSRSSGVWADGRWVKTSVQRAETEKDLPQAISRLQRFGPPYIVQETIEGPGVGVFILMRGGRILAAFAHRRLREKPPAGGVSTLSASAPLRPDLLEHSVNLLKSLQWDGVAMVEFKEDLRDGLPKLMEVNGRFWGSLELATACGIRFPSLLVKSFSGPAPAPRQQYRLGKKLQWILGDLDHVLAVVLKGRKPPQSGSLARTRAVLGFLRGLFPGVRHQVFSLGDPGPWLREAKEYTRNLLGREGSLPEQQAPPSSQKEKHRNQRGTASLS